MKIYRNIFSPITLFFSISNYFVLLVALTTGLKKNIFNKIFFYFLTFFFFFILKIFIDWSTDVFLDLSWLAEAKILITLFLFSITLNKIKIWNLLFKSSKDVIDSFIIFSSIFIIGALISGFGIFRFVDKFPIDLSYISIYYGICVYILMPISSGWRFIILVILLLLSGSGSAIAGGLIVVVYRIMNLDIGKIKKTLIVSFSIFFLLGTFIFGQVLRERDLSNFETIDRYILSLAGIEYISKNFTFKEHLIGMPYGSDVNAGKYMSNSIRDYLYAENNKKIFPRNFHSDYLRIYLQYGSLGSILFLFALFYFFRKRKILIFALMISALANSVFYITPIIFLLSITRNINYEN